MESQPPVAMFQEIKTPLHKLASLEKLVAKFLPNYTLFAEIAGGTGAAGRCPYGVATLVCHDYMDGAKVILVDPKFKLASGRVLAVQVAG